MKLIDFTLVLQNIIMEHSKNICPMQQVYDQNNKQYHSNFENVAHQTLMRLGSNLTKQLLDSYSSQTKNVQHMSENQMKRNTSSVIAQPEKLTQRRRVQNL